MQLLLYNNAALKVNFIRNIIHLVPRDVGLLVLDESIPGKGVISNND